MAVVKRFMDAYGRSILDPRLLTPLADEFLQEDERTVVEQYLLSGSQGMSLVALEDCYSLGEITSIKGRLAFAQGLRAYKGPSVSVEPGFVAEVRELLASKKDSFDVEYFARKAIESFDDIGHTYLHLVAATGYLEYAQFFIEIGCVVDVRNKRGETPLLLAMECRQAKTTLLLLSAGADPTAAELYGRSPLHYLASFQGEDLELVASALFAMSADAPLSTEGFCEEHQAVPWHYYKSLASGTPLSWAVARNNVRAAEVLLHLGADPLTVDTRRCPPIYHAIVQNEIDMVKLFIAGDEPWTKRVRETIESDFDTYVRALVAGEDFQRIVVLGDQFKTARWGIIQLFELLELSEDNKALLLFYCVDAGLLKESAKLLESETYQKHLDAQLEPLRSTCLQRAIQHHDVELFDLLMKYKPDLTIRHGYRMIPYLPLTSSIVQDPEVKEYFLLQLLEHGADVTSRSMWGLSPLCWTLFGADLTAAKILYQHGGKLIDEDDRGVLLLGDIVSRVWSAPEDTLDFYFQTLTAEKKGIREFVVDTRDNCTALHLAAERDSQSDSINKPLLTYLLGVFHHRRFINFQDNDGDTALHVAAKNGNPTATRLLLEAGADRSLVNREGDTALTIVRKRHDSSTREQLCQVFEMMRVGRSQLAAYDKRTRQCIELLENYWTVTAEDGEDEDDADIAELLLGREGEQRVPSLIEEARKRYPLLFRDKVL